MHCACNYQIYSEKMYAKLLNIKIVMKNAKSLLFVIIIIIIYLFLVLY